MPIKDRQKLWEVADDVAIFSLRSSAHPVEYAITLRVLVDGSWQTIHLFDNSHAVDEHHEHRYVGDRKLPPTVVDGDTNAAMAAGLCKLFTSWARILETWKRTR